MPSFRSRKCSQKFEENSSVAGCCSFLNEWRQSMQEEVYFDNSISTSNLRPKVLIEILSSVVLPHSYVDVEAVPLQSLVARRNENTHGQATITNLQEYERYEVSGV